MPFRLVRLGLVGLSLAATVPNFTMAQSASLVGPSKEVCFDMAVALKDYVSANVQHFPKADKAELSKLNNWIRNGCKGTLTLVIRIPGEVTAAVGAIQTRIGMKYDLNQVIKLVDP